MVWGVDASPREPTYVLGFVCVGLTSGDAVPGVSPHKAPYVFPLVGQRSVDH